MTIPMSNIATVVSVPIFDAHSNIIDYLKQTKDTDVNVTEDMFKTGTRCILVEFVHNGMMYCNIEGYYREGCYCFCVGTPVPTYELEIDDTTSLDPKNLTGDDITILEITNPHLPKELLYMYLMIKDLLDTKNNVEELIDNMRDYVYSLSN